MKTIRAVHNFGTFKNAATYCILSVEKHGNKYFRYFLNLRGTRMETCRKNFTNVYQISQKRLRVVQQKLQESLIFEKNN